MSLPSGCADKVVPQDFEKVPLGVSWSWFQFCPLWFNHPVSCFSLGKIFSSQDDDSNHHVAFVAACANLRARCYTIPEASKLCP
mgnify:CR=1 FL=1